MSRLFKIFLIIALSVFSDTNLSANDTPSTIWESYDEPLELDPFQLVIFLNDSKYQIIAEGIKGSEFGEGTYLVPALFLEYTDQKKFNEDVQFAVEVGFDALTVLSSGGTLLIAKNLTTARKWWLIFEVANSSTNILINYAGIKDDPKWKKVLAAYNLVTLGLNLGELTYSAAKGLKTISNNLYKAKNIEGNFLKSTDDFIEELNDFNKAQHDLTAAEKEMLDEFEEVVEIAKRRSGSTKVLANAGSDVLPEVFGGARQYVRNTYPNGQDILNSLTQKFGNNQGAAAEIIKKFGDDGLAILNKSSVNFPDWSPFEIMLSTLVLRAEVFFGFNL